MPLVAKTSVVARRWPWIVVGVTVLLVLVVRFRLRDMPLERDEGEYAYAGQLMLQGVPPYKEVYNMKLPGTYAAYALIMAVLGQSAASIHVGLAIVNAISIVLVFLLGRKLLDDIAGASAAIAFALMSMSPSVLGLAGHATHFVVLFALAGFFVLLRALENLRPPSNRSSRREEALTSSTHQPSTTNHQLTQRHLPSTINYQLAVSGLLFGIAFLMKQHGLIFGLFGLVYLIWWRIRESLEPVDRRNIRGPKLRGSRSQASSFQFKELRFSCSTILKESGAFVVGLALPYVLMCLVLAMAGVFHQFVFWTISYAGKYASANPWINGPELLRAALRSGSGPDLLFWILIGLAAVIMWWEKRLEGHRFFVVGFSLSSFVAVSLGFYFRQHYFIQLLPAVALLAGVAVSRAFHLLKYDRTIELFLAIPILALFVFASGTALVGNGAVWFASSPDDAVEEIYNTTLFRQALNAAEIVESQTSKRSSVAVLGSEPEIFFYSKRRSATGYIYTYPVMEEHEYASKMQEQMIEEIERSQPEFVIFVCDNFSWLARPHSSTRIHDWLMAYWAAKMDVVTTLKILEKRAGAQEGLGGTAFDGEVGKYILVLKRKAGA